jgi:predicted transcriptional regulator
MTSATVILCRNFQREATCREAPKFLAFKAFSLFLTRKPERITMPYMDSITIRLPSDLKKRLREFCKRQNRPAGEVVRDSLRRYLAIEQFQALRKKTLPFAEAQGILTDEDVFRIVS